MSSSEKGLAGRYAGALYELAVEAKATDAILSDLIGLKSMMLENAELNSVIQSPVYARTEPSVCCCCTGCCGAAWGITAGGAAALSNAFHGTPC